MNNWLKVWLTNSGLPFIILGVQLQHVHDLVVVIGRGFLVARHPVVQLPVVAGTIDDVIVLVELG